MTWGLWLDLERLRAKDMFRTFNSLLSARDENNRQGQCDALLDQTGPNIELNPTRLHRKRLQQRRPHNHQKNLKFIEGNAENLPFENSSFDVVYNVESSHCYGNMGKFVDEVFRVLRKGGAFCWTDFRDNKSMQFTNQIFLESGFTIVSKREITNEVLDALDSINDAKKERIEELVPKSIRRSFETFAGVEGTPVYDAFKNEKLKYFCFQMIK